MSKIFKVEEVAGCNKPDNLHIIIDGDVYDVTKFQDDHPGKRSTCARLASLSRIAPMHLRAGRPSRRAALRRP
jgi:hypothetical protein